MLSGLGEDMEAPVILIARVSGIKMMTECDLLERYWTLECLSQADTSCELHSLTVLFP